MSIRVPALALCGLLACSGPAAPTPAADAPAPTTAQMATAQPTPAQPVTAQPDGKTAAKTGAPKAVTPLADIPPPAKEPPLTQEEIDLIAADPATLSPEMRRKRAFARRRQILQNPDSPAARQLEALRLAHESGEMQAQMPDRTRDGGVTLQTPAAPAAPAPAAPAKQ